MIADTECARENGEVCETVCIKEENSVLVRVRSNHNIPGKCSVFYNTKMIVNREMCLCALASYVGLMKDPQKATSCLDAFGATGVTGIQWKRHIGRAVDVTVNDYNASCCAEIVENIQLNNMTVTESAGCSTDNGIHVSCKDANVILHQTQFHFIHLDPFGCPAVYMDAAFRNVFNGGMVIITATDVSSLYGTCPAPARRNYGANVVRTDYFKEFAVRIIAASAARSAAKCNKGVRVLYSVAADHFVQVAFSVQRGAQFADRCLLNIQDIVHCKQCQDWAIVSNPSCKLHENLCVLLRCRCHEQRKNETAVLLGPAWCGDIFDTTFIDSMQSFANKLHVSDRTQSLLRVLLGEASLNGKSHGVVSQPVAEEIISNNDDVPPTERTLSSGPLFYHCLYRRHIKGVNLPKLDVLIGILRNSGFEASPTHFDIRGALRTNAPFDDIICVLHKYCRQS